MFSKYGLTARGAPAIISSFPIIVFNYFFLSSVLADFLHAVAGISWISELSVPLIFIFLLAQVNRFVSIEVFEKRYFHDGLEMPTTNFLMSSDPQYSDEHKQKIHEKILKDFGIQLFNKEQEKNDPIGARRRIVEAVSLIRGKVGEGKLLLQHNIEYGFVRNLIGGSLVALVLALGNFFFFRFVVEKNVAFAISNILVIFYLLPIILSRKLLSGYGNLYAKILIQEYISF